MAPSQNLARPRPLDLIIGRGILTTEAIADELRRRLAHHMAKASNRIAYSPQQVLAIARDLLSEYEPLLAENILSTDLAAWIAGADQIRKKLTLHNLSPLAGRGGLFSGGKQPPTPPRPPTGFFGFPGGGDDLPPRRQPLIRFPLLDAAVDDLISRSILTRDQYDRLTAAERNRAFTVAGDITRDTIFKIRDALTTNIQAGASFGDFKKAMRGELEESFLGPGHLETVFRTNAQTAFSEGHETIAENPIVAELFPYQEYLAINDSRARHEHVALEKLGLNNTNIFRRDDPVWSFFTPPWDYNCRCGVNLLTVERAAERGVVEARKWLRTGSPPIIPEWCIQNISFRPQPGWGSRRKAVAA